MKPSNQRNYKPKHRKLSQPQSWRTQELGPDGWSTIRVSRKFDSEPQPLTLPLQARNWYEFCTNRMYEYDSRGQKTAGQIFWLMRFWVNDDSDEPPVNPVTEEGFKEVQEYLDYKLATVPHAFG